MSKYSLEFKKTVVAHYLSGIEGYKKTAKRFHMDIATVHKWVAAYRYHGEAGLRGRQEKYTVKFKVSVIRYKQKHGLSVSAAAAKFNILSFSALRNWERLYNIGGVEALSQQSSYYYQQMKATKPMTDQKSDSEKTTKELIKELNYLRAENAYLKKLRALTHQQSPAKQKRK